jgi:hypothetical protein
MAARELANELDRQPKHRGYIEWRVGWKPERGRFETWSSGSSTVIEESDEAERQLIMDELGASAQLILARPASSTNSGAGGAPRRASTPSGTCRGSSRRPGARSSRARRTGMP